jgi:dolichyl-phosphate beta-glucosyltransferase
VTAPYLSVVIPSFNEANRLGPGLDSVRGWLDARHMPGEVVVVDDGSTDGTSEVAEARRRDDRRVRVLRFPANRGKGAAVREGALASEGSLILVTDADLSTPIEELDRLLGRMRETSSDVVIGSRGLPGSRIELSQPIWRRTMGRGFNIIIRTLTDLPYRDTQCGFKLLDREKTVPIFRKMVVDRFAYDVELLVLARLAGLRILEEPVLWRDSPDSRVAPLRASWNMFGDVLRLRGRLRRGFYRAREEPAQPPGTGASLSR